MAVPKRRHSNSRTNKRRSHDALDTPQLTYCPKCNQPTPSHAICAKCGHYQGRALMEVKQD